MVPRGAGQAVFRHAGITVGAAVVGREEQQVVVAADALVQNLDEMGDFLVQLHVDGIDFGRMRAVVVGAHVGVGNADGQQVGGLALTQFLVDEGLLGKGKRQRRAHGQVIDIAGDFVVVFLVEVGYPTGQFVHVIGAGDKRCAALVIPVGAHGVMACRQDGGAVLEGDAHGAALEIGGQLQLVGNGGGDEVAGRLAAGLVVAAHAAFAVVLHARHVPAVKHEVVARDAVEGRCRARVDARMSCSRHRGHIVDDGVIAQVTVLEQGLEATLAPLVIIEVVPPHLVHNKAHNQFRPTRLRTGPQRHHSHHNNK